MSAIVGNCNWPAITRTYQLWEEHGNLDEPNDPAVHAKIARQIVKEKLVHPRGALPKVRQWLTRPEDYSPTVDAIAIERALRFDRVAIENLTALEERIWMERLAKDESVTDRVDTGWSEMPSAGRWAVASKASHYRKRNIPSLDGGNVPGSTLVKIAN